MTELTKYIKQPSSRNLQLYIDGELRKIEAAIGSSQSALSTLLDSYALPEQFGKCGTANDTTFVQAAIDTGKPVLLTGRYDVAGLVVSKVGQSITSLGTDASTGKVGVLRRRAGTSGPVISINASRVELSRISVQGFSAAAPGVGDLVTMASGVNRVRFIDCAMYYCDARVIKGGQCSEITIRGGNFDNTQAGAGATLIEIGNPTGMTDNCLYCNISGITCLPSGNPIVLYSPEGCYIGESQISGLKLLKGSFGSGPINRVMACRITGDVTDECANTQYIGDVLGAHTVTFSAGSSGILWIGERGSGSNIVNLGSPSNIVIEPDQSGISGYLHLKICEGLHFNNNKQIRMYNAANSNYGLLSMSTTDNFTLQNLAGSLHMAAAAGQNTSQIVGGVTAGRFDDSTTANATRFLVYDTTSGTLKRVFVGAADSAGAGFRALRIVN